MPLDITATRSHLLAGQCIPALPLALTAQRKLDERHQRALIRYYVASGAGGLAVGVHTTQFEIRDAAHNLLKPVLELADQVVGEALTASPRPFVKVAGICGTLSQAVAEAELARGLGYDAGLVSLAAYRTGDVSTLIAHCRAVADVIPVIGFYLQPAVGGLVLPFSFWAALAQIENVVAVKIAAFSRYQTIDVVRAVVESGRDDIALYTGNDDNIVIDLLSRFRFSVNGRVVERRIVGGLLGHWAVWTKRAVELLSQAKTAISHPAIDQDWLARAVAVTDSNAAFFDAANGFRGCIPGIHEVLRRQGLLEGVWCLDPDERLSNGQADEIERVWKAYPDLNDDEFVAERLDTWLS